jgi:hypothetical protein
MTGESSEVISVQQLRMHDSGKVDVYLSNFERFEYDHINL